MTASGLAGKDDIGARATAASAAGLGAASVSPAKTKKCRGHADRSFC
jgi:hypothetical protein